MWDLAFPSALLLLPLPLLVRRYLPERNEASGALRVPPTIIAGFASAGPARAADARRRLLPWVMWGALLAALAGPRAVADTPVLPASDREIVVALDLSGSMMREDMELEGRRTRRVEVLKRVGSDFIRRRAGDRVGLVIFADEAYLAAAPSYDVEAVGRILEEVEVGIVGRSTAIGDGLGMALRRLKDSGAASRVVVLLSDGSNNAGVTLPVQTAALAAELGIRVHTIALGPGDADAGVADRDRVDAATLEAVAQASGGTAFRVRSTGELEAVARAIDELEAGTGEAVTVAVQRDLWPYPCAIALLAALAMMVRRRP